MNAKPTELRELTLAGLHEGLGAKMVGFAGWRMPVQYASGLKAEHLHVRAEAGLFDVSHMGQLRVRARDDNPTTLTSQLESALPVDFDGWPEGLQRYTVLLNDNGGIEDDLMLTNLGDSVAIVVNAGNRDTDLARLTTLCPALQFEWVDAALIAVQGPKAAEVVTALDPDAGGMRFMRTATLDLAGTKCLTARAGYTGEDGFEISIPVAAAEKIARQLLSHPSVKPIGLGARDSLRLEAGLPLHGHDITPDTTPHEAGLAFAIAKSRRQGGSKAGGFPGATTVLAQEDQGTRRRLVGLSSTESVPIREGTSIINELDKNIGQVTSGTVSPSLGHPIMLAYLDSAILEHAPTEALRAQVRNKTPAVQVTALPFVEKRYKR